MFDLLDRPLHWITVSWPTLVPGKKDSDLSVMGEAEIELRVEMIDRDETKAMFPGLWGEEAPTDAKPPSDFEAFKRVVREWRKIKASGRVVPMTDENIKLLLKVNNFPRAFGMAYVEALAGQAKVREKNLSSSPGDGRGDGKPAEATSSTKTAPASD